MRFLPLIFALVLFSAPATAADLSKIDRTIKKEPTYKTKPKYCLLLFGPEAKTRAWLVLDGDVLFIDRWADGDLTHPEDRLKIHRVSQDPANSLSSETRVFLDINPQGASEGQDAPTLHGTARYARLWLSQSIPKDNAVASDKEQSEYLERLRDNLITLFLRIDDKYTQLAWACFSENPQKAPLLHFDAPLTLGFGRTFGPFKPKLVRGPGAQEMMVDLETLGLGRDAVVTMDNRYAPADVHPLAEIEFPSRKPGANPVRTKIILKDRC
jgi:hypothetical protein